MLITQFEHGLIMTTMTCHPCKATDSCSLCQTLNTNCHTRQCVSTASRIGFSAPAATHDAGRALLDLKQAVTSTSSHSTATADPFRSSHLATGLLALWSNESHPCGDASNNYQPWPGVLCDEPEGSVLAIDLRNQSLAGTLPSTLNWLSALRRL